MVKKTEGDERSGGQRGEGMTAKGDQSSSVQGEQTISSEARGPLQDIKAIGAAEGERLEANRTGARQFRHPSRNLSARARGFGIGGGYERPYRRVKPQASDSGREMYGPLPPAGYYGTGTAARPFERGEAGFADEMAWYRLQYGETTSGYEKRKK